MDCLRVCSRAYQMYSVKAVYNAIVWCNIEFDVIFFCNIQSRVTSPKPKLRVIMPGGTYCPDPTHKPYSNSPWTGRKNTSLFHRKGEYTNCKVGGTKGGYTSCKIGGTNCKIERRVYKLFFTKRKRKKPPCFWACQFIFICFFADLHRRRDADLVVYMLGSDGTGYRVLAPGIVTRCWCNGVRRHGSSRLGCGERRVSTENAWNRCVACFVFDTQAMHMRSQVSHTGTQSSSEALIWSSKSSWLGWALSSG